jgi:hypothetical protein
MSISSSSERHIIARNAHELALSEPKLFEQALKDIAPKTKWQFNYSGEASFKKYFRGEFDQVSRMIEFYEKPEAFVASMNTPAHLKRAELLVRKIIGGIPADSRSLVFATLDAYSLALTAIILRELGAKNVVLNFLSSPTINGSTKSFEAYLLLLAYDESASLQGLITPFVKTLQKEFTAIHGAQHSFYLEEDETPPPYQMHSLPESIRAQIGQKASRMVYRLGLTPDRAYVEEAKISHVILCDASGELGPSALALQAVVVELGPKKLRVIEIDTNIPHMHFEAGIYEQYLARETAKYLQTQEYYTQNSNILNSKTLSSTKPPSKKSTAGNSRISSESDRINALTVAREKRGIALLYLGVIPLLVLGMALTLGAPKSTSSSSTNSGVRSTSWWNSNWSSGGVSGGSWSSNASKNTDSISKSFWGGGFSRWGGSSSGGGG